MNAIANHDLGPIQVQQLVASIKSWNLSSKYGSLLSHAEKGTRQLTLSEGQV